MRVAQFITLFLALSVVTGCSHRRASRPVTTSSLCECSTCRCDQERLIRQGAVPADHFENYEVSQNYVSHQTVTPLAPPPQTNDFVSEYASEPVNTISSPYSSGNPIEMDGEAPQAFGAPVVDEIKTETTPFLPSNSSNDLQLDLPSAKPIVPADQVPTETFPGGAFKPFNREVFKVKDEFENAVPFKQETSDLVEKASETFQPKLSSAVAPQNLQLQLPPVDVPESNEFKIPEPIDTDLLIEQAKSKIVEKIETVENHFQPSQPEPTAEMVLEIPEKPAPLAQSFQPIAQPIRQTETVIEGELYEDPIVLYAQQRRGVLTASAIQKPGPVRPATMQKPVKQQQTATEYRAKLELRSDLRLATQ